MEKKGTGRVFRIIVFSLTALMIGFAFVHSAMPATASSEESGGILDFLINFFNSIGVPVGLTDHIIRKSAHFAEYFVIGGLLYSCAFSFDRFKPYRYSVQVMFAGLLTAVIDETIQLFSEGRSGEIKDVLLDFTGIIAGVLALFLFYLVYVKIKYKRKVNGKDGS